MLRTNPVFRPLLWPTLMTVVMLPALIGLGTWQLQRLDWKEGLIAEIEARRAVPPMALPPVVVWGSFDVEANAYRAVHLSGRYLNDLEVHVYRQNPEGAAGYYILTPVALEAGGYVYVDRGFVPGNLKEPAARASALVEGPVEITGTLRAPETPGMFDNPRDPDANIGFVRQPAVFAADAGLAPVAPFYVASNGAEDPSGLLEPAPPAPALRNEHLGYAITWFSLAFGLLVIYVLYHLREGRIGPRRV